MFLMQNCITETKFKKILERKMNLKFTKEGMIPNMAHLIPILYNSIANWI